MSEALLLLLSAAAAATTVAVEGVVEVVGLRRLTGELVAEEGAGDEACFEDCSVSTDYNINDNIKIHQK